ncbi:MAG: hypothetical protein ACJ749_13180, partial [Flavisolibacter sp.]
MMFVERKRKEKRFEMMVIEGNMTEKELEILEKDEKKERDGLRDKEGKIFFQIYISSFKDCP